MSQNKKLKDEIMSYALRTGHIGAVLKIKNDLMDLTVEVKGPSQDEVDKIYSDTYDAFTIKKRLIKAVVKDIKGTFAQKEVAKDILENIGELDVFLVDKLSDEVGKYIRTAYEITGLEQLDFFRPQSIPTPSPEASDSSKDGE